MISVPFIQVRSSSSDPISTNLKEMDAEAWWREMLSDGKGTEQQAGVQGLAAALSLVEEEGLLIPTANWRWS